MAESIEQGAEKEREYSCEHYKRKCRLVAPCCNKEYTCRFCHDEKENHAIDRRSIQEMVCMRCEKRQDVQQNCTNCQLVLGEYYCNICHFFDDSGKDHFHCEGCGICRIGNPEQFFHCVKCDMCLPAKLQNNHKCVEQVSRQNCAICLEDIHTSRTPAHIPACGHLLHTTCYEEMVTAGLYACPTCQVSMLNLSEVWKHFDNEISVTPMPPEYANLRLNILCKDCHKKSCTNFHVIGLKCAHCGSYNTCRDKGSFLQDETEPVQEREV